MVVLVVDTQMNETEQKPQKQKINMPNAPPPLGCVFQCPKTVSRTQVVK